MLTLMHLANRRSQLKPASPVASAMREFGKLIIHEHTRDLPDEEALDKMRQADVLVTMWGARCIPPALATDPGRVRYVLNLTGTCREFVPPEIIRSPIPVTNWGDAPANPIAEGAMSMLLAMLKVLPDRRDAVRAGSWPEACRTGWPSGTLKGARLGIYGCGVIGHRFLELVRPFKPDITIYDPYIYDHPLGTQRVVSLEALFTGSEIVVIMAGLSDETADSVDAKLLARMPDHSLLINVARGEIVVQEDLFAELRTGRLRAALDVLAHGDSLPPQHEAREWPNLLLTCHDIHASHWPPRPDGLGCADRIAIDNLRRFLAGEPLRFVMDERRYALSS